MSEAPVVILVKPQLGENIGTAARAMFNGGLTSLRLVQPKFGWPNPKAVKPAAGATAVLGGVKVFETTADAVADLQVVYACTARRREMRKEVFTPQAAAHIFRQEITQGRRVGFLFGPEKAGLENDDVALSDGIIHIPLNPDYTSLNLAQAVLILAYEWIQTEDSEKTQAPFTRAPLAKEDPPATKSEVVGFFEHLEEELSANGYFRAASKKPSMIRSIRNIFAHVSLTSQEVRTLRGIVRLLAHPLKDHKTDS